MAPILSLLFSLLLLISPSSSRTLPTSTPSTPQPGPIQTLNQNYKFACDPTRFKSLSLDINNFAYCNKSLSYYDRVDDLISRMSVGEKVHQISDYAYGVDRIGLPEYKWWSEILHGVSTVGEFDPGHATSFGGDVPGATQFPEVILSTASFNESLWKSIAQVI